MSVQHCLVELKVHLKEFATTVTAMDQLSTLVTGSCCLWERQKDFVKTKVLSHWMDPELGDVTELWKEDVTELWKEV